MSRTPGQQPARSEHRTPRVVLVAGSRAGATIRPRLSGAMVHECDSVGHAFLAVASGMADVIVIDASVNAGAVGTLSREHAGVPVIAVVNNPDAAYLRAWLRAGVRDVVDNSDDLLARVRDAARARREQAASERRAERKAERLRGLCRSLIHSRNDLVRQVGDLCSELATSYRDLSGKMGRVSMSSELSAILRQELDLEGLLRTTLEYTLRKVGPMNAAVFLPGTTGDYSLGAYVNYDCPRDSAESLLDHLADVAAPAFEDAKGVVVLKNPGEIASAIGRDLDWAGDCTMIARACRGGDECLAVMVFFRDRRNPYAGDTVSTIDLIAEHFGRQLDRVIRTHNRHIPRDQWDRGRGGSGGPDDIDLAA